MSDANVWTYHNPVRIVNGPLELLAEYVLDQHVLLVTTHGFVNRGVVSRIKNILGLHKVIVWDKVKSNPNIQDLDRATQNLRSLNIGCVIGLGGGSALDSSKVLATTILAQEGRTLLKSFRDKCNKPWTERLPLIVIPTTSGTGSEVTPFATIWDHEEHKKYSLAGDFAYPDVALLDATLTLTLGEEDTLYPALDAISHALESLWNKNCTPVSRAFAFQVLALSNEALLLVLKEPHNLEARRNMQSASVLAGLAISQTRTAVAHSISYPLTSHFGVPHGLACSFTLPKLLEINIDRLVTNTGEKAIAEATLSMLRSLELPSRLNVYVDAEKLRLLSSEMINSDRMSNYRGASIDPTTALKF